MSGILKSDHFSNKEVDEMLKGIKNARAKADLDLEVRLRSQLLTKFLVKVSKCPMGWHTQQLAKRILEGWRL